MEGKNTINPIQLGPLLYSDDAFADATLQHIKNQYPSLIGVWIDSLQRQRTDAEKCFISIRGLFETLNQVVGLICASIYLHDQSNETEDLVLLKSIHEQFAHLSMPSTGTWAHLLTKIIDFYQNDSRRSTFPIPELLDDIQSVLKPEHGYDYVVYRGINNIIGRDKSYFDGRVLFAGVNLRNIIHHDKIRDYHVFKRIYPYYRDILLRTLRAFSFLDKSNFRFIRVDKERGYIDELHGVGGNSELLEPTHSLYQYTDDSVLYLHDVKRDRYLPLHPFFLQIASYWEKQGEFMLASLSERQAWFIGRNGLYRFHEENFTQIQQMLSAKQIRLATIDWNRLEPSRFIQLALETTRETLSTYQRKNKYLSDAYFRRKALELEFEHFLTDNNRLAMIVWGEGGMGKSALLCDIAHRYLPGSEQWTKQDRPSVLPLFFNAGVIRQAPALQGLIELLKKHFMVMENHSLQKIEDFFYKIDSLINEHKEEMPHQVLFIVDAINESNMGIRFFMELYELVKSCADPKGRIRYSWLKIIYSTRPINYQKGTAFGQQLSKLIPNESLFYRSNTEIDNIFENWQVIPYVRIQPYTLKEMTEVFKLYTLSEQYNYLNNFDTQKLEKKILPYQSVLIQPILLRFFTDLLNNNKGVNLSIGIDGYNLFREYYHHMAGDSLGINTYVDECLDRICYRMITQNRNFLLPSELLEIRYFFDEKGQEILGYVNPVEELLHYKNVLGETQRLLKDMPDLPAQVVQSYQFTYQKFGEYTFAQYFNRCYGHVTPDIFYNLLATDCILTEYNTGLVWYGVSLWKSGRLKELFNRPIPKEAERYWSVLIDLMLEEWVELLVRKTTDQILPSQVISWCRLMKDQVFYTSNPLLNEPGFATNFYKKITTIMKDWAELQLAYDFIMEQLRKLFNGLPIDESSAFFWLDEAHRTVGNGQIQKGIKLYQKVQNALVILSPQLKGEFVVNYQVLIFHIHTALGQLYQRMHYFDMARQELEQANNLATELYHHSDAGEGQRALKAWALGNLSAYLNDQFELEQALNYNKEQLLVLELLSGCEYLPEQADVYYKRAKLFGSLNKPKEQISYIALMRQVIDRALQSLPRSKRVHKLERMYHLLVAQIGEGTTAKESLQRAEEFFQQAGGMEANDIEWIEYGAQLSEVRGQRADFADEATAHFEQAIKCWKKAEKLIPGDWAIVIHRITALKQLALAYRDAGFFLHSSSINIEVKGLLKKVENKRALPIAAKISLLEVYLNLSSSMIFVANTEKDIASRLVNRWLNQLMQKSDKLLNELLLAMPSKNYILRLQVIHQSIKASILYHRQKNNEALQLTLKAIEQKIALREKTDSDWVSDALGADHYRAGIIYGQRFDPFNAEEAEYLSLKATGHLREGSIELLKQYEAIQPAISKNTTEMLIYSLLALSTQEKARGEFEYAEKNITLALSVIPTAGLSICYETRTRWRIECTLAMADFYTTSNTEKAIYYYQQAIDEQKRMMERLPWSYEQGIMLVAVYGKLFNSMRKNDRISEILDLCDREYMWIKDSFLMKPRQRRKRRNLLAWINYSMSNRKRVKELLYMTLEFHTELALGKINLSNTKEFSFIFRAIFRRIFRLNKYR